MMGVLDKIPKSFLIGLSLASIICVIGLIIHVSILASTINRATNETKVEGSPLVPGKGHSIFSDDDSHLGIYSKAALSVDAAPCAKIGTDVLRRNGTVVDAAIAALFCNGAVHSHSMGIGGGFIMTVYIRKERKSYSLMARETAPKMAREDMYANNSKASSVGALSIAVPGEVLGYVEAKKRFGNPRITFESLVEPTIKLCEDGLPFTRALANIPKDDINKSVMLSNIFKNPRTNDYYNVGETYKRPLLAQTLRRIAKNGADEIYGGGETGKKLVEDIKEMGGIITEEDLKQYRVIWEDSVQTTLANNLTVFTSPPPASGAILAAILGVMSQFQLSRADATDAISYHRFTEACKYGFAKRTLLGDWSDKQSGDDIRKLVKEITSSDWARTTRHKIRDDFTSSDPANYGAKFANAQDGGTAHLALLAPNGDAVSVTSTVNSYFGSHLVSKSTDIILNNQMDDFASPGFANVYNIEPSPANFIRPGRRPVSSMVPTIIVDGQGDVKMVVGASGGPKIITATAFVTMMHIWFGRNIKESIDAQRIHHQLLPMQVTYENGLEKVILDYLSSVGHNLDQLKPHQRGGVVQGIAVEAPGIVTANNDFRKAGEVDGL